jgi:hypothetical protein
MDRREKSRPIDVYTLRYSEATLRNDKKCEHDNDSDDDHDNDKNNHSKVKVKSKNASLMKKTIQGNDSSDSDDHDNASSSSNDSDSDHPIASSKRHKKTTPHELDDNSDEDGDSNGNGNGSDNDEHLIGEGVVRLLPYPDHSLHGAIAVGRDIGGTNDPFISFNIYLSHRLADMCQSLIGGRWSVVLAWLGWWWIALFNIAAGNISKTFHSFSSGKEKILTKAYSLRCQRKGQVHFISYHIIS